MVRKLRNTVPIRIYGSPLGLGNLVGLLFTFGGPDVLEGFFAGFGLDTVVAAAALLPKNFTSRSIANFLDVDPLLL